MFRLEGIPSSSCDQWAAIPALALLFATATIAAAQMPGQKMPGPPPAQVEQTSHGLRATAGKEVLEVTVCADSVIHIVATPDPSAPAAAAPGCSMRENPAPVCRSLSPGTSALRSSRRRRLRVTFNIERGSLSFSTADGDPLLNEGDRVPRTYEPVELNGESTYHVADRFTPSIRRSVLRTGPASGRHVQLPRRHG